MAGFRRIASLTCLLVLAGCGGSSGKPAASTTTRPSSTSTTSTTTTVTTATTTTTTVHADAGAWSLVPNGPNSFGPPVAWTGKEILVARSGCCDDLGSVNLSAFDPSNNTWRRLPPTPLTPRHGAAGAWTGTEMIVAGGFASANGSSQGAASVTDGAAWNASTNTWHAIAPMPTTLAGADPTAVWTGKEMLVWSSTPFSPNPREVVLAYNPATNTWRRLPPSGLALRAAPITVWTGHELVVWGGFDAGFTSTFADGARLDPATGTWRPLPPAPVPGRGQATAAWTGHEVILWGGDTAPGAEVGKGAAYDPTTNTWRALPASPLRAKTLPASAWTGHFFVVVGGSAGGVLPAPGPGAAAYDPATDKWTALPPAPASAPDYPGGPTYAADQREDALAVWTGTSVVVVGGLDLHQQAARADGVEWTPAR